MIKTITGEIRNESKNLSMKLKYIFLLIGIVLLSNPIFAVDDWGQTGHRVVGKIAEQHLNGKTKRALKKLLDGGSLALYSTYADEIKADERYDKFYTWHYINMSFDETYESSSKNPDGDLATGIEYCINIIKDKSASIDDKAFYLKLLIHLIGDLHQPMHIGLKEDRGGNDFKVLWFDEETNLHSVWDTKLIENYNMSYSELAENLPKYSREAVLQIQRGSVVDWINETHQLTKQVYSGTTRGANLKYRYSYDYLDMVKSQLHKGGIRLAKVLNDLF